MSFAERLYDMMRLRRVTTLELSKGSGISRNTIYEMLKGKHPCQSMRALKAIAKELGCTPGWLLKK